MKYTVNNYTPAVFGARSKKGFTLIELLVVVLIIGILAAVALPQYNKAVMKSRAVQALLFMHNAGQALDRWVLENGTPNDPINFIGTTVTGQLDVDLTGGMTCSAWECSDNLFTYSASWEPARSNIPAYWNASVNYKRGEAEAYIEYEPASKYRIKSCGSYDDEGARFCTALCSLDNEFC